MATPIYKGIQYGLRIDNDAAVDSRYIAADQDARFGIPAGVLYKGLLVYQQDEDKLFILNDTDNAGNEDGWREVTVEGYDLPIATHTTLGGVIVPASSDIAVDGDGNITIRQVDAAKIVSGTIDRLRLPSTIAFYDQENTWTRNQSFEGTLNEFSTQIRVGRTSGLYGSHLALNNDADNPAQLGSILFEHNEAVRSSIQSNTEGSDYVIDLYAGDGSGEASNETLRIEKDGIRLKQSSLVEADDFNRLIDIPDLPDGNDETQLRVLQTTGGAGNPTYSWATLPANNGEANVQSDWDETDTTSDAFIRNKPVTISNSQISDIANNKSKLAGIQAGAEVNVQSDWTATSGDALILNKPTTITTAQTTKLAGIETGADVTDRDNVHSALGISNDGSATKFLNEQGSFVPVTGGGGNQFADLPAWISFANDDANLSGLTIADLQLLADITTNAGEINKLGGISGSLVSSSGNGINGTPTNNQVIAWDDANDRLYWRDDANTDTDQFANQQALEDFITNKANFRDDIGAGTSSFSGSYDDLTDVPNFATVATSGAYSDLSGLPDIVDGLPDAPSGAGEAKNYNLRILSDGTSSWTEDTQSGTDDFTAGNGILIDSDDVISVDLDGTSGLEFDVDKLRVATHDQSITRNSGGIHINTGHTNTWSATQVFSADVDFNGDVTFANGEADIENITTASNADSIVVGSAAFGSIHQYSSSALTNTVWHNPSTLTNGTDAWHLSVEGRYVDNIDNISTGNNVLSYLDINVDYGHDGDADRAWGAVRIGNESLATNSPSSRDAAYIQFDDKRIALVTSEGTNTPDELLVVEDDGSNYNVILPQITGGSGMFLAIDSDGQLSAATPAGGGGGGSFDSTANYTLTGDWVFNGEIQLNGDEPTTKANGDVWVENNNVIFYTGSNEVSLSKLTGIESNADVTDTDNVESALGISDSGSATLFLNEQGDFVATTGEANVQSNWNETDTDSDAFIQNKPTTITSAQAGEITANTAKVGVSSSLSTDSIAVTSSSISVDLDGGSLAIVADEGLRVNYEGHKFIGSSAWNEMALRPGVNTHEGQSLITRNDLDSHTFPQPVVHSGSPNTLANLIEEDGAQIRWRVNDDDGTAFSGNGLQDWYFQPLHEGDNSVSFLDGDGNSSTKDFRRYTNTSDDVEDSNSTVIRVIAEDAKLNSEADFKIPTYLSLDTLEPCETYIEIRRRPAAKVNWGSGTSVNASPTVGTVIFRSEVVDRTNGDYTYEYTMSLVDGQTATFENDDMIIVNMVIRSTNADNTIGSGTFFSFGALDDSNHDWTWTLTTHYYDDIFELEDNGDIRIRINDGEGTFDNRKLYNASTDRWFGLPEAPSGQNKYELNVASDGATSWTVASSGGSGIDVVTSDPTDYTEGDVFYNSTDNVIRYATTDDNDSNPNISTVASQQYVLDHSDDAIEHLGTYVNVAKNSRTFELDNSRDDNIFSANSFGVGLDGEFDIQFSSASDLSGSNGIVDTWNDLVGSEVYVRFTNQDDPFSQQSVYRISPVQSALDNSFVTTGTSFSHISGPAILNEDADGHGNDYIIEIRSSLFHIDVFDSNLDGLAPKRGGAASDAILRANATWQDLKDFDDLDDAVRAASFNYINIRSDNPNHTYTFESSNAFSDNQFGINGSDSFVLSLSSFDDVRASDWNGLSDGVSIFRIRRHDDSRVGYYRCSGYVADNLDFLISGTSVIFIAGDDVMNDSGEDGVAYYIEIPNGGAGIDRFKSGHDGIVAGPSSSEADKGHVLLGDNTWSGEQNKHLWFQPDSSDGSVDDFDWAKRNFTAFKAMNNPAAYDDDYYIQHNFFYYQTDMSSVGGYSEGALASIVRTAGTINGYQDGFCVKVFRYNSDGDLVREDLMYINSHDAIEALSDFQSLFDTSNSSFNVQTWAASDGDNDPTPVDSDANDLNKLHAGDWKGFDATGHSEIQPRFLGAKHYILNDEGDVIGIQYVSRNDSRL